MTARLSLWLAAAILLLAATSTVIGSAGLGPTAVPATAAALVLALLVCTQPVGRLALALGGITIAIVAFSPAIGAVRENLIYSLPIYHTALLGATPLETLLAASVVLAVAARVASGAAWPRGPVVALAGLFALLLAIAAIRGEGHEAAVEFRLLLPLGLAFAFAASLPLDDRALRWIRAALIVGVIAGATRTLILVFLKLGFLYGKFLRVSVDTGDFLLQTFALLLLCEAGLVRRRRHALFLAAPVAASLLFSFARGAWMAALISLASVALLAATARDRGLRRIALALPVVLGVVALLVAATGSGGLLEERMTTIFDWEGHAPNVYRVVEARNALAAIGERPVWGGGLGAAYDPFVALRTSAHEPIPTLIHNSFLWLALKGGGTLAGAFLALLVGAVFVLAREARRRAGREDAGFYLAAAGVLIGYLALSQIGALVQHVRDNVFLGLLLGIAAQLGSRGFDPDRDQRFGEPASPASSSTGRIS